MPRGVWPDFRITPVHCKSGRRPREREGGRAGKRVVWGGRARDSEVGGGLWFRVSNLGFGV